MQENDNDITAQTGEIMEILQGGGTLGDVYGYSAEEYEAVYSLAHGLYRQGRYGDALKAFAFLVMHNHMERRFLLGLASSCQMLKQYEKAIEHYTLASVMDIEDPLPTFHTAECLMAMGHVDEALEALEVVIVQSDTDALADVRARAEALRTLVRQSAAHS